MRQLVYFSTAASRQDETTINEILSVSRQWNVRNGVTGLLVAGGNRYLQILEGSHASIDEVFARIQRDQRHLGVNVFVDQTVGSPWFSEWTMAFCRNQRLNEFATFRDLSEQMHDAVEPHLRYRIRRFSETFATSLMHRVATPWPSSDTKH